MQEGLKSPLTPLLQRGECKLLIFVGSPFVKGGREGDFARKVRWEGVRGRALLLFVLIGLFITPADASDYYVDAVNGNDTTGDGTETNPWKKLQFAIDSVTGTEENPHTLYLAPGHYGPAGSGDEYLIYLKSYLTISGRGIETSLDLLRIGLINSYSAHYTSVYNLVARYIKINYHSDNILINNCILIADGIGLSIANESSGFIRNCSFFACKQGIDILFDCSVHFQNCVFFECLDEFRIESGADVTFSYCRMDNLQTGEGNIYDNPMFLDAANRDFRLRQGSPCIDSGNPSDPVPPGGGSRIDMGCHEYTFTPQLYIEDVDISESAGNHNGIPELNESGFIALKLANGGEDATDLTAQLSLMNSDLQLVAEPLMFYPDLMTGESSWQIGNATSWSVPIRTGWCIPAMIRMDWTSTGSSGTISVPLNLHSDTMSVDAVNGNDQTGDGSPEQPLKTIGVSARKANGSRWHPITIQASQGVYSPSFNGEIYPVYLNDYESLCGESPDTTILDNDNQPVGLIVSGSHTSLYNLTLRSVSLEDFRLFEARNCTGEVRNTRQERQVPTSMGYHFCSTSYFGSNMIFDGNTLQGDLFDTGRSVTSRITNNEIYSLFAESGLISNNHIGYGYFWFNTGETSDPIIILNNEFESMHDTCDGYFHFSRNTIKGDEFSSRPDSRSIISGNVLHNTSMAVRDQPTPFAVTHNIMISDRTEYPYPCFYGVNSAVQFYNNAGVYLIRRFDQVRMYSIFMSGAFSMDHCLAMFVSMDAYWDAAAWGMNGISYFNMMDSNLCQRASYSDLPGCPLPTNLDVEPGIRGSGTITEIGPGYLKDNTAAWIPGAYQGLPVNPAILHSDRIFRCEDNNETTLFFSEEPSDVAEVGDVYFFPDFELRRISNGYAYDSPLIDAGNPDPAYHDPDGSRCDIGPWGGPLSLTPLPGIPTMPPIHPSFTPTPGFTPTPTPSHTPPTSIPSPWNTLPASATPITSPTPTATSTLTPTPAVISYELTLNAIHFDPGDPFGLIRTATNAGSPRPVFEIIVLDVYGSYYFWPEWTPEIQGISSMLHHGSSTIVVLQFTWPDGDVGHAEGLQFWGGCIDPQTGDVVSNVSGAGFAY